MKKNYKDYVALMCLLSTSLGTSAWSQGPGGHGGPGGGWGGPGGHQFNGQDPGIQRMGPPARMNDGCGPQFSQPAQSALLGACIAGGNAGMQTAQRFASQQGRNDGFRTGYAWGLRQGIDSTISDPNQINAGRGSLNVEDAPLVIEKFAIADQAGSSSGASQGTANGNQEAIGRFHSAIDSGSMPSQTLAPTDLTKYNPQYSSAYGNPYAQTVGPIKSELDILSSGQIDPGQVQFYSNGYDNGIFGNAPQFRPVDFYSSDGRYGFDRNRAMDGGNAFNMYVGRGGFNHSDYDRLGTVQIITGYTTPAPVAPVAPVAPAPVAHAPGAPAPGHAGGPGHGPTAPVTPPAPVAAAPAAPAAPQPIYTTYDLKQIYHDAFVNTYSQSAGFYYNNSYNDILNDGTNAGYFAGQQVGERLAFQSGMVNAFNAQFRQREGNAFLMGANNMRGYNSAFNAQFAAEYSTYANNPEIGVDSFSIAGIRNDGIVQPGEGITASYVVRNYGGVSATLPVVVEGDVTGAAQASLVVPALTTSRQAGTLAATISANVPSQSNANVVLDVNGNRIPLAQYVTNQVVAKGGTYTSDMPDGNISVSLPLQNVSTANSYDAIKVIITDSLGRTQTLPIGFLAGGQTWSTPTNLSGFNPLDLIDGKVSVQIQALLGSVTVGASSMTIEPSDSVNHLIAKTFEVAASGTDTNLQAALSSRIYTMIQNEAFADGDSGGSDYKNDANSLIAALLTLKASHPQSGTTLSAYQALASSLNPLITAIHKRHGGFFGSKTANEKYFASALQTLSSN
jgi:hypothetical protein